MECPQVSGQPRARQAGRGSARARARRMERHPRSAGKADRRRAPAAAVVRLPLRREREISEGVQERMYRLPLLLSGRRNRESRPSDPRLRPGRRRLCIHSRAPSARGHEGDDHFEAGGSVKKLVLFSITLLILGACATTTRPTATATLSPSSGQTASGTVTFTEQADGSVQVSVNLTGVP